MKWERRIERILMMRRMRFRGWFGFCGFEMWWKMMLDFLYDRVDEIHNR